MHTLSRLLDTPRGLYRKLQDGPRQSGGRGQGGVDTYFCLSRESLLLMRLARLVAGTEWTDELFLQEEWDECDRLVRDWPALWSNCIRQKMRSEGTSSNPYGGLVMTYLWGRWRRCVRGLQSTREV